MYPDVKEWFYNFLKEKFPKRNVKVFDTSKQKLSDFIIQHNLTKHFPEFKSYEIKIDILGILSIKNKFALSFVECKLNRINLLHISQLLGYSKVARPEISFIISPKGISSSLNLLFNVYRRYDVLKYCKNRYIIIARWDPFKKDIDYHSIIPPGQL